MGLAFVFGDNVDTDQIIPTNRITSDDPDHLAKYCLSGVDPEFTDRFAPGDVVVAGTNFGCGSSREHAPIAIRAAGADAVVAELFARIFFRNAINIGLPVLQVPNVTEHVSDGDDLTIDVAAGTVTNETVGEELAATGLPPFVQEIVDAGGLIEYEKRTEELEDGERTN
jgi:3-isopropylmalate/(R)-2-methylmalate dehydratase small subunit